jgi:hypothetical protein
MLLRVDMELPAESIAASIARRCANHGWRAYEDSKVRIVAIGLPSTVIAEFISWADAFEYLAQVDALTAPHRPNGR